MTRPLFDPSKMAAKAASAPASAPANAASAPAAGQGGAAPMRVAELAALIENALRTVGGTVRVVGEISNFTNRQHWYFAIKDAEAVVPCVMFAGRAKHAGFVPADGQEVVVSGRVEFYKPQGRVSFYVESIEPVGAGALQLAYQKLVEELRRLGWTSPQRKRPLPSFPRRVVVITSRTGAALQDVLATARKRCPAVDIAFIDVKVQGESAAPEVCRAIDWVSREHRRLGVEAILLTRGGGSIEDLWAFNERSVAEAIVNSAVPVVAAIGHETDVTIAELVADERCATPTQAAMRLTPDRESLAEQNDLLIGRLSQALRRELGVVRERRAGMARRLTSATAGLTLREASRLDRAGARLERVRPAAVYAQRQARLSASVARLTDAMRAHLVRVDVVPRAPALDAAWGRLADASRDHLSVLERQLALVGPQAVLARGYSVTFDAVGRVVRRPTDVQPGDAITTRLRDGTIDSTVAGGTADRLADASPLPIPGPAPQRRSRRRRPSDSGPGLFA